MDGALLAAVGSAIIAAVSLFYAIGKDRSPAPQQQSTENPPGSSTATDVRLDSIAESIGTLNEKLDNIVQWQMEATSSRATQEQQIATLINRVDKLEGRLDLQENAVLPMLNRILERID